MPILRPKPTKINFNGIDRLIYEYSVISLENYTTTGESKILTKDIDYCEITLDSKTTKQIFVKSMTTTLIKADSLIDEEYEEILLEKGACVELGFIRNFWYVLSSDGIKNS
jgi:hypothetical protein